MRSDSWLCLRSRAIDFPQVSARTRASKGLYAFEVCLSEQTLPAEVPLGSNSVSRVCLCNQPVFS